MARNLFIQCAMALRRVWKARTLVFVICVAGMFGAGAAVDSESPLGGETDTNSPQISVKHGHECEFGDGTQIWVSEIEGKGIRSVRFTLLWIAAGKVEEVANGTYDGLRDPFSARAYVLSGAEVPSEKGLGQRVDMSAAFLPGERGVWERKEWRVPTGMKPMHERDWWSAQVIPGEAFPLLTAVFSRERKVVDPIMRGHKTVQEWLAITKNRPEGILVAEVLFQQ